MLGQAFALTLSPLLPLSAMAQATTTPVTTPATTPTITTPASTNTTVLPTDIVPLVDREAFKTPFGELLQLKMMQRLPSRFYCSGSIEVTGRDETNPFQFPTKRALMSQLPRPAQWRLLAIEDQVQLYDTIGEVARSNAIFRALPNASAGWTITPHARIFTNYFLIRDQLAHSMRLNTVIHSWAVGLQKDWTLGTKGSAQLEFQGRNLWQLHQQSVFDFLPGLTLSYIATPRTVLFVNGLVQMRGKSVFEAPTKELDPFFTWGGLYQKNGWTFSASSTFVQNFREPFHHFATIPKNSYVLISDYEIARRIVKQYPGLQAFVRAEPIWNFHSHNTPSLAGMDFRFFAGMRFAVAKQPLTTTLQQIREQLKQETEPSTAPAKPSAQIPVEDEITLNPQPIHGFLEKESLAETCQLPDGQLPVIAEDDGQPSAANQIASQEESSSSGPVAAPSQAAQVASVPPSAPAQTPVKTLDEIATSTGAAHTPASGSANLLDISSSKVDWNDFESQQAAVSGNQGELHSIVDQAAGMTNSLALQERSQKIRDLSEKKEKEYKLATTPVAPVPSSIKISESFVPKLQPAIAVAEKPVMPASSLKRDASVQSLSASVPIPQPSSLKHTAAPLAQSAPFVKQTSTAMLVPSLSAPEIGKSDKVLQPLERSEKVSSGKTYSANLAPSVIKHDRQSVEPLPLNLKTAAAPNVVPTPVSGRSGISAEKMPAATSAGAIATAEVQQASKPVVVRQASRLIPIEEAKLDKFTASAAPAQAPRAASSNSPSSQTTGRPALDKAALIATAAIPRVERPMTPAVPQKAVTSSSLPDKQASAKVSAPRFDYVSRPIIPPRLPQPVIEETPIAVSELSENEIISPKIAMAVYDSWQSPVVDDPLIGSNEPARSMNVKLTGARQNSEPSDQPEQHHKRKQVEQKRTDMRLIPPLPQAGTESKNSPLQNLQIPVMPVR